MWLISAILIVCVIKVLVDWYRPKNFPPGPRGLPFVGNILDVQNLVKQTGSHGIAWCQLAKQYGSVVGLRLGLADPLIIVSGREAVMEMLGRQEFDGRPNGFIFAHRTMGERRGVLFTDGKIWNDQRRFSLRNLRDFGWGTQTMEELILEDAVNLIKVIAEAAKKGVIENLSQFTSLAVLNSIWSLIGGFRYDISKGDPKLVETLKMLNAAVKESSVSGGLLNHLPFLRHIAPQFSGYKAITERLRLMWSFFADEVTSHKDTRQSGVHRDLIDVYLEEIEARHGDPTSTFNEMQLVALIKDFFSAGVDTTTNSIGFAIGYLAITPEVQDKVQEELDRVLGRENLPSVAARPSLPYMNATLAEVLRLANIGPTSIPHRAVVDTQLKGYDIKKDSMMLANLMSVHQDKEHWGDPDVFRPERFLDENNQFINDPWVVAFGAGRRKCLGEGLARNSHFLFVSCLLQKFNFSLPPGHSAPAMQGMDGFTLSPPVFDIIVTPRPL
ncbi:methyl farnesoate epoxidase [Diachasma alloeum]|uniref:methyl farnesoate epoxidase n=1 Tax=Diachasma alloeum TaxID=454923 RepID=UPI0007381864|nr:methyl farnesoate epoxidase [Diachasma alloeum]